MDSNPFIVEGLYNANISTVWKAITHKSDMEFWYFDIEEFKAEPGFEFTFYGGTEEKQYLHLCKIIDVLPNKKLSYSWRYDGYAGDSMVSFELFDEGENTTRLKLTHKGLESFPAENTDFKRDNFVEGWTHIIKTALKDFLEYAD